MIVWDEELETGIPKIDEQHKELITHFNNLLGALLKGRGREETDNMLDFLKSYSLKHFELEELYMEASGCPAAEENKAAHQYFVEKFGELYEQRQSSGATVEIMVTTIRELTSWFLNHIVTIDAQLYEYVKEQELDDD